MKSNLGLIKVLFYHLNNIFILLLFFLQVEKRKEKKIENYIENKVLLALASRRKMIPTGDSTKY